MGEPELRSSSLRLAIGTLVLLLGALAACSDDPGTGPLDVKWDRFTCERCRMVLSDRKHGAQVRIPQAEGRSKVLFFDDIGCAVVWLEDKPFRDDPKTEIWVTDWRSGAWIDARTAGYLKGQASPRRHGIGAQWDQDPRGMTFEQARASVLDTQARTGTHPAHRAAPAGPTQGAAGRSL